MRQSILSTILTFLACACHDARQDKVQLTDTFNLNVPSTNHQDTTNKGDTNIISKSAIEYNALPNNLPGKVIMVSSGQISPYTTIQIDDCIFDLVTRDNDTIYLATKDRRFKTPEGYKVGTEFSELPKDIQRDLTKELGWGYNYKLLSGWTLGFCEGSSCTDYYPQNSSKVKWIFKRQ